jgi:hypothetical protein
LTCILCMCKYYGTYHLLQPHTWLFCMLFSDAVLTPADNRVKGWSWILSWIEFWRKCSQPVLRYLFSWTDWKKKTQNSWFHAKIWTGYILNAS